MFIIVLVLTLFLVPFVAVDVTLYLDSKRVTRLNSTRINRPQVIIGDAEIKIRDEDNLHERGSNRGWDGGGETEEACDAFTNDIFRGSLWWDGGRRNVGGNDVIGEVHDREGMARGIPFVVRKEKNSHWWIVLEVLGIWGCFVQREEEEVSFYTCTDAASFYVLFTTFNSEVMNILFFSTYTNTQLL